MLYGLHENIKKELVEIIDQFMVHTQNCMDCTQNHMEVRMELRIVQMMGIIHMCWNDAWNVTMVVIVVVW